MDDIGAAAKAGDQAMAIGAVVALGAASGALLFEALALTDEPALLLGGILGVTLGGLTLMAEGRLQRLAPGSIGPGAWIFVTCVAWGLAFGWAHDRLRGGRLTVNSRAADRQAAGRRSFLRALTGATVALSAVSLAAGRIADRLGRRVTGRRWSDDHAMPNAAAAVVPVAGTRPEFTALEHFYRIDTDTRAPSIDASRWRLAVGGLVDRAQTVTLQELTTMEPTDVFATLCCISNPVGGNLISTTRWTGVSLQRLLSRLPLQRAATHLRITSADGFFESIALDTIRADRRVMLAYAWDGVPLPVEHGYPLRLYVPDLYGMKQPKWIVAVDAVARWEPGYWVARGWDRDGRVSIASAIDVAEVERRDGVTIVLGGVAFAGARGVSKVEVRVDEGPWRSAALRAPLSDLTWVVWRAVVPADPGPHALTVRAFDTAGQIQPGGYHSRRTTV